MTVETLLAKLPIRQVCGPAEVALRGVSDDSRLIEPGFLFIARTGRTADGARFIDSAIERGAVAVLTHQPVTLPGHVTGLVADDPAKLGINIANELYNRPADRLKLIGVTGTNGKTTTAFMIRHLLGAAGHRCGLIGTIEIDDGSKPRTAELTTPGAVQMIALLGAMVNNGCTHAVMEVSSHALHQGRVSMLRFDAAIFTNLSGDHLDYHGSMDAYADAKAMLFASLAPTATAIINADDPAGERMRRNCRANVLTFGFNSGRDIRATVLAASPRGTDCVYDGPWGKLPVALPLTGKHNVMNMAGALGAMHALGLNVSRLADAIADCAIVPGRLEPVRVAGVPFTVLVDYAHTDDALANVLTALRPLTQGRLRVLFGCGGDRDATKRPRMAKVAAEFADELVITSDNPRTENPLSIIDQILAGIPAARREQVVVEPDRAAAIEAIITSAKSGDVVLLAGKGHEDYQIIGTTKRHFDDREAARAVLEKLFTRAPGVGMEK
ncbi:MAG: UDP-N-acetylmuramoyl-L-alanyl-D-glutamate--2,6-diaminopimelate ligase [Planctomycetes bacterium]|nr:UDP-N-acetylmuramoyl-L-alanyl-D-glutamate--2,6-diaminopimelate ligase [Planctomycetota bacterium]